jgi:hypothetical protein
MFLVWIGMTQPVLQLKFLMQNMKRLNQRCREPTRIFSAQQKADLKQLLSEFTKLFDGTLGVYPHKKYHIELEPGAKPRHARKYTVPVIHLETFKKELMHLCEIGVLQPQGARE